jgi:hypothetical protein
MKASSSEPLFPLAIVISSGKARHERFYIKSYRYVCCYVNENSDDHSFPYALTFLHLGHLISTFLISPMRRIFPHFLQQRGLIFSGVSFFIIMISSVLGFSNIPDRIVLGCIFWGCPTRRRPVSFSHRRHSRGM